MESPVIDIEGTWEEIEKNSPAFRGKRIRVTDAELRKTAAGYRPASGRGVLRHAGTWAGNDLRECLQDVIANRSKARF